MWLLSYYLVSSASSLDYVPGFNLLLRLPLLLLPLLLLLAAASVVAETKECCILISERCGQAYVTLQVGTPAVLFSLPALFCLHFLSVSFANVHSPTGCDCYNNTHEALLEC